MTFPFFTTAMLTPGICWRAISAFTSWSTWSALAAPGAETPLTATAPKTVIAAQCAIARSMKFQIR
jgi:hypothetical protein